jgi:hypothetical protein
MCNIQPGELYEYVLNDHTFIVTAIQLAYINGEGSCWFVKFQDSGCVTKVLARELKKPD